MRRYVIVGAALLAGTVLMGVQVGGASEPQKTYTRVYSPYTKVELSEKQSQQIATIQGAIRDKIKALEAEEKRLVFKVLNEKQVAQLAAMDEEARVKRAEYSRQYRQRKKAEAAAASAKAQN